MTSLIKTSPIPTALCVPLAVLAAATLQFVVLADALASELDFCLAEAGGLAELAETLLAGPLAAIFVARGAAGVLSGVGGACGVLWALVSILGLLVRRRWSLVAIRAAYVVVIAAGLVLAAVVYATAGLLADAYAAANPEADNVGVRSFLFQWQYLRWVLLAAAGAAGMLVLSWRGRTIALYGPAGAGEEPAPGDRFVENVRTGGRDPAYRRSWLSSSFLHWFVIIALPFLWALRGCVEPYLVPYGRGKPRVTRVMRVVKRKKKRKKYILRQNTAVIWEIPDLNESKIAQQVNEETQLTHAADRNAVHGQMGAGDGTKGGWPDGVPGGKIRFIRLEYRGRDWDDGMDAGSRADINFLTFLRQEVPFPVARKSESHAVRLLSRYPAGFAPPFVYMTGSEHVYVSRTDRKILREYLLQGGMLFADCGSRRWDHSFRGFIRGVFPDKRLIDIADDDEIFQMPYAFTNGAPPLWHHGGFRALGIKHQGRWVVFYHPGDINDAWKTGHSGMDSEIADKAFQMGINIMYYSITKYLQLTRKHRRKL